MTFVWAVEEWYNEYPELGGGNQGTVAVFSTKEKAEEWADAANDEYNKDGYSYEIYTFVLDRPMHQH